MGSNWGNIRRILDKEKDSLRYFLQKLHQHMAREKKFIEIDKETKKASHYLENIYSYIDNFQQQTLIWFNPEERHFSYYLFDYDDLTLDKTNKFVHENQSQLTLKDLCKRRLAQERIQFEFDQLREKIVCLFDKTKLPLTKWKDRDNIRLLFYTYYTIHIYYQIPFISKRLSFFYLQRRYLYTLFHILFTEISCFADPRKQLEIHLIRKLYRLIMEYITWSQKQYFYTIEPCFIHFQIVNQFF